MGLLKKIFGDYSAKEVKRVVPIKNKVLALEEAYAKLTDKELQAKTPEFKERLANGETLDDILPEAFAACREASWRVLGMKHFPVQIIGGIVLHQGRIAEMKTGEGKTLVATLPAYLNALSGDGVHIVTVNDYLARRDSEWMGKLYKFMGLKVGLIVHGLDNDERKAAYAADITYGTNNEMGFDYLRDNMVPYKENKVQRGHNFAIVDEVDSILIDEARTPLIISGRGDQSTELYTLANNFVHTLTKAVVKEIDSKQNAEDVADGDYIVDEKARTASLTKSGIAKAEAYFNVDNLMDAENMTLLHHINQAIKAVGVMRRDIDYVVKDNQVLIVDEFTGRIMLGRRYNEGLHQAIEAKEGVKVEHESKTLATITFQNYFRLYKKLSGMTGTAMTESQEFQEIYSLDVVEIPTNKPMIRIDNHDLVYKTEAAKYNALINQVVECHEKGQPVLVGTVSIEKSEVLSKLLKSRGIKHEVLNAKFHEKEAEIVAQAGKFGAVTIATNMAGRGTDILLGGNPDFLARQALMRDGLEEDLIEEATGHADTQEEAILEARQRYAAYYKEYKAETDREHAQVVNLGGLHIIGTERHESRRIDNQLRGRAGRQGDPGSTRFYVSLQDDLMRRFGGDRLEGIMSRLNPGDELPIESGLVTKQIEAAQKRVEMANFETRKNVLRYDDVMNKQRSIIYGQRRQVLMGEDMHPSFLDMIRTTVESIVTTYCPHGAKAEEWNLLAVSREICELCGKESQDLFANVPLQGLTEKKAEDICHSFVNACLEKKERELAEHKLDLREVERIVLLRSVDSHWMDHIDVMDQLRQGIGLRAYAQRDPVVAYTNEGFDMFDAMVNEIREEAVRNLMRVTVRRAPMERKQVAKPVDPAGDGANTPMRKSSKEKVGRNDPCPCGSGKKYKNCHGKGL